MMNPESKNFELEGRRIARSLWPSAQYQGAQLEDGREHDGIFFEDYVIHFTEFTISRNQDKAKQDIKKMVERARSLRKKHQRPAICWFVTKHEPTPEQRRVAKNYSTDVQVKILSISQFRNELIDVNGYVSARNDYRFGSMDKNEKENFEYIELDILSEEAGTPLYNAGHLANALLEGRRFLLLGDFGSGKSATIRELFMILQKKYFQGKTHYFPIALNLRDHFGQDDYVEALHRHAKNIGFGEQHHLVRAFNAGYVILLLDGFDELAIKGWSGNAASLKELRRESMELVRQLSSNLPDKCGVVISGRTNYFSNTREMRQALQADRDAFVLLNLEEFNDEQMQKYISTRNKKGKTPIPDWIPGRPLLFGYLFNKAKLRESDWIDFSTMSPLQGWDSLLQKICDREAEQSKGRLSGELVRLLIERLASRTRAQVDEVAVAIDEILSTFAEVSGRKADDAVSVLIQRLPGLTSAATDDDSDDEEGTKRFLDTTIYQVAQAGDVYRYLQDPYNFQVERADEWTSVARSLVNQAVVYMCEKANEDYTQSRISAAIYHLSHNRGDENLNCVTADILGTLHEMGMSYEGQTIYVSGVYFEHLHCEDGINYSNIEFHDCIFQSLELSHMVDKDNLPLFVRCHFGNVDGILEYMQIPQDKFNQCEFDSFASNSRTTSAILSLDIPMGQRVLLTVLKKLYLQAGAGRQQAALFRGLDQKAQALVQPILNILDQEGLAIPNRNRGRTIWLPVRSQGQRVKRLISAPNLSNDDLLDKVKALD